MSESTDETEAAGGGAGEKAFKRNDLVAAVAEKTGLPRTKAHAAVEALFDVVGQQLKAGQEVRLVGFGSFTVKGRKAGKGRDPRTGSEIEIPEGRSVRFKPGKSLKEAVSGAAKSAEAGASSDAEAA